MGTEYKVGTISQILAQSSGGGAKEADPKLAALFGGAAARAPTVYRTVKVDESTILQKPKKKTDKASEAASNKVKQSKKDDKKRTKLKLKIKDALAAINKGSESDGGQQKVKKDKKVKAEVPADASAPAPALVAGGVVPKKGRLLRRKLRKLNELNGIQNKLVSSTESTSLVKTEGSQVDTEKVNGINGQQTGAVNNGVVQRSKPISAKLAAKKELKKNKRKERRRLEIESKEREKALKIKQEKIDAGEYDEDSDGGGETKVKIEPQEQGAETKPDATPKTLAERNAPKSKDAELEARTIFVGNLPKDAQKKELKKIFKKFGTVETIRYRCGAPNKPSVLKKVAVNKKELHPDNETIAAYVRYSTMEEAEKAAAESRGMTFRDHHLTVDVADQGKKKDNKLAIFVGNLHLKLTDEELWRFFEDCGKIVSVRIVRDNATGMGKGFGYINFEDRNAVDSAIKTKNQQELRNRAIRISRCVKKLKVKKEKYKGKGNKKSAHVKQEGSASSEGKWKGKKFADDKKPSKVHKRVGGPATEYSGDRLAEIGKLKRKSNKPNRGDMKKAKIVRLLTEIKLPNKKKSFK